MIVVVYSLFVVCLLFAVRLVLVGVWYLLFVLHCVLCVVVCCL